jgi:hypothetical protein
MPVTAQRAPDDALAFLLAGMSGKPSECVDLAAVPRAARLAAAEFARCRSPLLGNASIPSVNLPEDVHCRVVGGRDTGRGRWGRRRRLLRCALFLLGSDGALYTLPGWRKPARGWEDLLEWGELPELVCPWGYRPRLRPWRAADLFGRSLAEAAATGRFRLRAFGARSSRRRPARAEVRAVNLELDL